MKPKHEQAQNLSSKAPLSQTHPDLAKQWHPTQNGSLTANDVTAGSGKRVWWLCSFGDDHTWEAKVAQMVISLTSKTKGCPVCRGLKVVSSNCLATVYPELAKQFHPTKNGILTAYKVHAGSHKKVYWLCPQAGDHEWIASIKTRTSGNGCPVCRGSKIVLSNCLTTVHPELAKQFHPTKNGALTAYKVHAGSHKQVYWLCPQGKDHEWIASIDNRINGSGCPYCNSGWTANKLRLFIKSLLPQLHTLTPAGLFVLLQQTGVLNSRGKGRTFVQMLTTGKFPKEDLVNFANNEPSLVDKFLGGQSLSLEQDDDKEIETIELEHEAVLYKEDLQVIETKDILQAFDDKIYSSLDREAVDFFIKEKVAQIWQHAFYHEKSALSQITEYSGNNLFTQEVKQLFLQDYKGAKALKIPKGYGFLHWPNLMQQYAAHLVQSRRRIGNWSGTGAGKTLSAILASRVVRAKITIICCPNNVIGNWQKTIHETFADSIIYTKDTDFNTQSDAQIYLILNYEFFQQPKARSYLKKLLETCIIDFIIIDEIHYTKQRVVDNISQRKKVLSAFISEASIKNSDLHVLGMSATPVINNLFEGKTMIELITGVHHDELDTKPTVSNCIALYQKFITNGIRWLPRYTQKLNLITESINCEEYLPKIRKLKNKGSIVELEAILARAKQPYILDKLQPKTIVYTHYLQDIFIPLQNAIQQMGWKVAVFTGECKDGLASFIEGDADILIASSCAGTGVDGLQKICNRLIINVLPWTHAEFEQLKGRLYRQGQQSNHVDVFVPLTYAIINGERWSWCDSRWKRIQYKKSIADAAVDGVIPEGHLRTPAQAYQDTMQWLIRLENGEVNDRERQKISIPLVSNIEPTTIRRLGDLSRMNHQINHETSIETQQRFSRNPSDWKCYHAQYRENRKDWKVVPYQEAIMWCKKRSHMVIGDFGCGEAFLAAELPNQVHSFDHVAINEKVIACDMTKVPLENESLDAAIFSLSLMGINFVDYLIEAQRCLKLDGYLWIAEPTSRIKDINLFQDLLFRLGFDISRIEEKWKFTFIKAIKTEREPNLKAMVSLNPQLILD